MIPDNYHGDSISDMGAGVVSALTAGIAAVLSPVLASLKKHDSEEVSNG